MDILHITFLLKIIFKTIDENFFNQITIKILLNYNKKQNVIL